MNALVMFAQLQQPQQREIAGITDELCLLSTRSHFSVVDERLPASQDISSPVVSAPTVAAASAPPATGSSHASACCLTAAPVLL